MLFRSTTARPYPQSAYRAVRAVRDRLLEDIEPNGDRGVELAKPVDPPTELAASLLYRASDLAYAQILERLEATPAETIASIGDLAYATRGTHDHPLREARVGHQLVFDVCLDNGAFRDLHRHRNCVQIVKDFAAGYGYDTPSTVEDAGVAPAYRQAMEAAGEVAGLLDAHEEGLGQYALPLGYRRRALFKMDAAQLGYMVETRTKPAGHFSYREITYQMFEEFQRHYPSMAHHIRVTHPDIDEFFER